MHFFVYYIVPILLLLQFIQTLYVRNLDLKYQYKYHAMRDKLQLLAINRVVNRQDPLYIALDNGIAKNQAAFKRLNIFLIAYLWLFKQKNIANTSQKIKGEEIKYKNSKVLNAVYSEYRKFPLEYVKQRYIFLIIFIAFFLVLYTKVSSFFKQ